MFLIYPCFCMFFSCFQLMLKFFSKSTCLCLSIFICISEDYGKTFQDVTNLINNTFISTEFGIAIGPENSGKVSGGTSNVQDLVTDVFLLYQLFFLFQNWFLLVSIKNVLIPTFHQILFLLPLNTISCQNLTCLL